VTHPFKQVVIPALDALDDSAERLGAVNTIRFENDRAIGYNTDWSGFSGSLTRRWPDVDLAHIVQIGAGGAGAATAYALLSLGCPSLLINDMSAERAHLLVARLRSLFPAACVGVAEDPDAAMAHATGVVQASPIGMEGHPGLPLPAHLLRPEHWVADVIYFPQETELLRIARDRGCETMNGNGMVVLQAAQAFGIFTGVEPNPDRMLAAFADRLQNSLNR
jgi:shikimate dehydrogenase